MSMAFGFYWGIFYPYCSPPYKPPEGGEELVVGDCIAPIGQPNDYQGYLFETTVLRSDYILYN